MTKILLTAWLLSWCAWSQAQTRTAPSIEGVLETAPRHAALMSLSAQSGDLVGYVFPPDSVLGRAVHKACVQGKMCTLVDVKLQDMLTKEGDALGFTDMPVAWVFVVQAKAVRGQP